MLQLTVAIPSYNSEKTIMHCIESCRNLKLNENEFEILVVDNCSTDNSLKIIEKLKNKFKNLKLIKNDKNIGRIQNWNKCLEYASGKYLIFLFTNDEIYEKNNIAKILHIFDKNEEISIAISPRIIKEGKKETIRMQFSSVLLICPSTLLIKKLIERSSFPIGLLSIVFRVEDIRKRGTIFPPDLSANADQVFSIMQASCRKFILFNTEPQIIWNATSKRFHFQTNIKDTLKGHVQAHKLISEQVNYKTNGKYLFTHYFLKFLFYLKNDRASLKEFFSFVLTYMKNNFSSFGIDPLFVKAMMKKLIHPSEFFHELFLKEIIISCDPKPIDSI